ncbi:MAG: AAA family ATPase [Lachnospiraceae bacterium]|nr:AAA family ATPase [Lachnospiraceae bacterium]
MFGMARTVGIGNQDFESIRESEYFYIDKTHFIREWWESGDSVTLITRPRRFGKTLNISMLEKFFSVKYAGRSDLFEGLSIWKKEKYRLLQGTYPVLSLSFADVKETSFEQARKKMCRIIRELYYQFRFLTESGVMTDSEKRDFLQISVNMEDNEAAFTLKALSGYLSRYYGKKVLILLDEYDTPMQEAYVNGYWQEMVRFTRNLFNSTFKTNPYLERAIMTGITRVSKESIFSDLNNLKVVTTTSGKYEDCFGFTEEEVFAALGEFGLSDRKQQVKDWYDGFSFGKKKDIYNPWSIINFLDEKRVGAYWANTSANSLVGKLIREGSIDVKETFQALLGGETLNVEIDEQIIYEQLLSKKNAVWSLLLASGYLKVVNTDFVERTGRTYYELALTNKEVYVMFENMIRDWFSGNDDYNDFIKAMLMDDLKAMNLYMNRVAAEMFSSFDSGTKPSGKEPERFYHGFVLGLMADLTDKYIITSNRESGFGRYDVMLEPRRKQGDHAVIIEFKVQTEDEKELSDTVKDALRQIDEKGYQANLIAKGFPEECIRKYGFAFCGKKVLIGR